MNVEKKKQIRTHLGCLCLCQKKEYVQRQIGIFHDDERYHPQPLNFNILEARVYMSKRIKR